MLATQIKLDTAGCVSTPNVCNTLEPKNQIYTPKTYQKLDNSPIIRIIVTYSIKNLK